MAIFTPAVVTVDGWTHVGKVSPPSISPETWGRLFEVCGVAYMLGQEQLSRNKEMWEDSGLLGTWPGGKTHQEPWQAEDTAPTRLATMWLLCMAPVRDSGFKSLQSLSPGDLRPLILLAFPLTPLLFCWLVIFNFGIVKLWKASGCFMGMGIAQGYQHLWIRLRTWSFLSNSRRQSSVIIPSHEGVFAPLKATPGRTCPSAWL